MLYIIEFLTLTIKNHIEKVTSCFEITKLLVRIISTPFHINFPIVVLFCLQGSLIILILYCSVLEKDHSSIAMINKCRFCHVQ